MVNRDLSFSETHWQTQRKPKTHGKTAIQTEEWGEERRVNNERRTSRRLRATMSAHHVVFPSFSWSVCLAPSGYITIPPLLTRVFLYLFCCYFSPLPLNHSLCFFLSSFSHTVFFTSLCFYSCLFAALHLFPSLLSFLSLDLSCNSVILLCTYSHRFWQTGLEQLLLSEIFDLFDVF